MGSLSKRILYKYKSFRSMILLDNGENKILTILGKLLSSLVDSLCNRGTEMLVIRNIPTLV